MAYNKDSNTWNEQYFLPGYYFPLGTAALNVSGSPQVNFLDAVFSPDGIINPQMFIFNFICTGLVAILTSYPDKFLVDMINGTVITKIDVGYGIHWYAR